MPQSEPAPHAHGLDRIEIALFAFGVFAIALLMVAFGLSARRRRLGSRRPGLHLVVSSAPRRVREGTAGQKQSDAPA
jgi:hypothetical protein